MFGALLTIETSIEKPYKFVYMCMSHDCVQPPLGCTYSQASLSSLIQLSIMLECSNLYLYCNHLLDHEGGIYLRKYGTACINPPTELHSSLLMYAETLVGEWTAQTVVGLLARTFIGDVCWLSTIARLVSPLEKCKCFMMDDKWKQNKQILLAYKTPVPK